VKTALLFAAAVLTAPALAGDLTPPAGPVSETMKPLDQVEPRIPVDSVPALLSQPGSYYLTTDLLANKDAIDAGYVVRVSGPDVTLDLMGFTIDGDRESGVIGIDMKTAQNALVRNGVLRDCQAAIEMGVFCALEDLRIVGTFTDLGVRLRVGSRAERIEVSPEDRDNAVGFTASGVSDLIIRDCIVRFANRGYEIENAEAGLIEGCRALNCDTGFRTADGRSWIIRESIAQDCDVGFEIDQVNTDSEGLVDSCTAQNCMFGFQKVSTNETDFVRNIANNCLGGYSVSIPNSPPAGAGVWDNVDN